LLLAVVFLAGAASAADVTVNLVSPSNDTSTYTRAQTFTFNYTSPTAATTNCTLYLNGSAIGYNETTLNKTNTALQYTVSQNGTLPWYVSCINETNATLNGTSGIYNFLLNDSPTITYNQPSVSLYNTSATSMTINLTANGTGSRIVFVSINVTLWGTTVNYTNFDNSTGTVTSNTANCVELDVERANCQVTVAGLANGVYTITATATDSSSNSLSSVRSFTLDTAGPAITLNLPLNGGYINNTNYTFRWTPIDQLRHNMTCNLTLNDAINQSNIPATNNSLMNMTLTSNMSAGAFNWSVTCADDVNNSNTSATQTFTLDVVAPSYSAPSISPTNGSNYSYGQVFSINITWADTGGASVNAAWLEFNSTNYTSNSSSAGGVYYFNFTDPVAGWHRYIFYANDTAGNRNSTTAAWFNYARAAPSLNITSTATFNITYLQSATITGSCPTSANGGNDTNCKLWIDTMAVNLPNPLSRTYVNFSVGSYTLTVNTTTAQNYSSGVYTQALTINKDTMPLHLYIDGNEANKTVVNGTTVTVNATKGYADRDANITLFMNGTAIGNTSGTSLFVQNTTTFSAAGTYTFILRFAGGAATQNFSAASNLTLVLNVTTNGSLSDTQVYANNATENVTGSVTQVVVPVGSPIQNVTIDPSVTSTTNISLNFSMMMGTDTVTIPNAMLLARGASYTLQLYPGTVITAGSSWNGLLNLPTLMGNGSVTIPTASGFNAPVVNAVIETGAGGNSLTLDHAAQIKFTGQTGKRVGYYQGGTFTAITTACLNTQSAGDALAAGGSCQSDDGVDLYVWTKHLTSFATYSQTPTGSTTPSGSNSGGGSPGSSSSTPSSSSTSGVLNLSFAGGKVCPVQIDRSMSSSSNLTVVTVTITNIGGSGCDLADISLSDWIPPTFASVDETAFDPAYTMRDGATVSFSFPTFSGGESRTLTYTVHRYMQSSKFAAFGLPSATARLAPVAPTPQPITPPAEEPEVQPPSAEPEQPGAEEPTAAPPAAPTPQPEVQKQWGIGELVAGSASIFGIVIVILVVAGIWYFYSKKGKKK
jgi:hypothetical protein